MNTGELEMPLTALAGLLGLFRRGRINALELEREGMLRWTNSLTAIWDEKYPGFPNQYFPYTSLRGQHRRGRRDEYLKNIIVRILADPAAGDIVVVNPACVFGRHARDLAARMTRATVVGTDIEPGWNRLYRLARILPFPDNYSFVKDNVFASSLTVRPIAVVFFGACGAVSDGAFDYAIDSGAAYLMGRTCCHDNIGGNLSVIPCATLVNRFFRFKNWAYGRMKAKPRYAGYYFSDRYTPAAYPRSGAARELSSSEEFMAVARNSVESDICRTIIDLDRYLYLLEKGFSVNYQGELFVALRK